MSEGDREGVGVGRDDDPEQAIAFIESVCAVRLTDWQKAMIRRTPDRYWPTVAGTKRCDPHLLPDPDATTPTG